MEYTSLKIVKKSEYSWVYYPNNNATGFLISKGYFTGDELSGLFQIVEQGKTKRPAVNILDITLQDESNNGGVISFTQLSTLLEFLTFMGNPLTQQPAEIVISPQTQIPLDFTYNGGLQEFVITPGYIVKNVYRGRLRLYNDEYTYSDNTVTIIYDVLEPGEKISITG